MKILTLAEAGNRLGLSPSTLRTQVHNGRLRATLVGKTWTVTEREVERYRTASLAQPGRRFRPCAKCGGTPAVHNAHPLNDSYVGHEYV